MAAGDDRSCFHLPIHRHPPLTANSARALPLPRWCMRLLSLLERTWGNSCMHLISKHRAQWTMIFQISDKLCCLHYYARCLVVFWFLINLALCPSCRSRCQLAPVDIHMISFFKWLFISSCTSTTAPPVFKLCWPRSRIASFCISFDKARTTWPIKLLRFILMFWDKAVIFSWFPPKLPGVCPSKAWLLHVQLSPGHKMCSRFQSIQWMVGGNATWCFHPDLLPSQNVPRRECR